MKGTDGPPLTSVFALPRKVDVGVVGMRCSRLCLDGSLNSGFGIVPDCLLKECIESHGRNGDQSAKTSKMSTQMSEMSRHVTCLGLGQEYMKRSLTRS